MRNVKRLLAILLALTLLLPSVLIPGLAAGGYDDVPEKSWYTEAVIYVTEHGYMNGVSETEFAPGVNVNRAMFVTVLARMAGVELNNNQETAFADVPEGKFYTGAVAWAAEKGIVNGVSETSFAPTANITRQDLCTILARFLNVMQYDLPAAEARTFTDGKRIAGYAKSAVQLCADAGLVAGYDDGTFRPKGKATRAQVAVIIMRLDLKLKGEAVEPVPMPAQAFNGEAGEDMTVSVNAPEGALPENTCMTVSRVTDEAALAAIREKVNAAVYAAADISFSKDGAALEPAAAVEVQISLDGLDTLANPAVVHIRDDGSFEYVNSELVSVNRGSSKALRFFARDFSVYAVVGGDASVAQTYSNQYVFHNVGDTDQSEPISVQYVGEGETLYNPGTPASPNNDMQFLGWYTRNGSAYGTKVLDAGESEKIISGLTSSSEIHLYPYFDTVYFIVYHDEHQLVYRTETNVRGDFTVSNGSASLDDGSGEYRIDYQPDSSNMAFSGWSMTKPADGSVQQVVHSVTFSSGKNTVDLYTYTRNAIWINFDKNDWVYALAEEGQSGDYNLVNGEYVYVSDGTGAYTRKGTGARYVAPISIYEDSSSHTLNGNGLALPSTTRPGYNFSGWNTKKDGSGTQFTANTVVNADTTVYAQWDAVEVPVYIVYWLQDADNDPDYTDTVPAGQDPATYTKLKSYSYDRTFTYSYKTGISLRLTAAPAAPEGFHVNDYLSEINIYKEVAYNGSTVFNVYYDRDIITLTFKTETDGYSVAPDDARYHVYGYVNGLVALKTTNFKYADYSDLYTSTVYVRSSSTTSPYPDYTDSDYAFSTSRYYYYKWTSTTYLNNVSYYGLYSGTFYPLTYSEEPFWYYNTDTRYTGTRYVPNTETVKTITELYGHSIKEYFPITQGTTTYNGYSWTDQTLQTYSWVLQTVDIMPSKDVTFIGGKGSPRKTIYYYVEAIDGETLTSEDEARTFNGKTYKLYKTVEHDFNFLTYDEEYHPLVGFSRSSTNAEPAFNTTYYYINSSGELTSEANEKKAPIPNYIWGLTGTDYAGEYVIIGGYYYAVPDRQTWETAKTYWKNYLYYDRLEYNLEFYDSLDGSKMTEASVQYEAPLVQYESYYTTANFTDSIQSKYIESLTHGSQTISHEGYRFTGWYADQACTTQIFLHEPTKAELDALTYEDKTTHEIKMRPYAVLDQMPANNARVYAGWTKLRYRVWVQPNGGTLSLTESTFFRSDWGELVQEYKDVEENGRNYTEDPNGSWYYINIALPDGLYPDGTKAPGTNLDAARVAYYTNELRTDYEVKTSVGTALFDEIDYCGTTRYSPAAYTFVGWFKVNKDEISDDMNPETEETDSLTAWNFNNPVKENLCLRAIWKRAGTFRVAYDGNMYETDEHGRLILNDNLEPVVKIAADTAAVVPETTTYDFGDLATTYTKAAPSKSPAGYQFIGWRTPDGIIHTTYDVFTIYSSLAKEDENRGSNQFTYTLTAVYAVRPNTSITYDANGGEGTLTALSELYPQTENPEVAVSGNEVTGIVSNTRITLHSGAGFTKPGYVLDCWTDKIDEDGNVASDGHKFLLSGTYGVGTTPTTLYAVWKRAHFYVFHSSTGVLQAFDVPLKEVVSEEQSHMELDTFDLTELVPDDCLYGGYYSEYGGVNSAAVKLAAKNFVAVSTDGWTAGTLTDLGEIAELDVSGEAYSFKSYKDATSMYLYDEDELEEGQENVRYWTKANAYGQFKVKVNGETVIHNEDAGSALYPDDGAVYFLKEVPDTYLHAKFAFIYNVKVMEENPEPGTEGAGNIEHIYLLTAADDALYSKVGFRTVAEQHNADAAYAIAEVTKGILTPKFVVIQRECTALGIDEKPTEITADSAFKLNGYLCVLQCDELIAQDFTMLPSWETLDGVVIGNAPLYCDGTETTIVVSADQP